jgi:nicotinic acid mononucleotide adenylyltransferase
MEFFRRAPAAPGRLGIFPGTFNPPTRAHVALAGAALEVVDEVLFVLPRVFPHKPYRGATHADRVRMLAAAAGENPRVSIAASDGGLFLEIAAEARAAYGDAARLTFLCGRDAAERILGWDYGRPDAVAGMLRAFDLLVASRRGEYRPPAEFRHRIGALPIPGGYDDVSATEVRDRLAGGRPWEHLVPPAIAALVREIYSVNAPDLRYHNGVK